MHIRTEDIIIIDIDEKSLKELGQWPWSRDKVARLLQNLADYGIAIVGLDVVFAEPDNSSPKKVLQKLGMPYENILDYDDILGKTIAETPTIVGYVFALGDDGFYRVFGMQLRVNSRFVYDELDIFFGAGIANFIECGEPAVGHANERIEADMHPIFGYGDFETVDAFFAFFGIFGTVGLVHVV